MGAIMYADDIVLLSPSAHGLTDMLATFTVFAGNIDLKLNASKPQYCVFGPDTGPGVVDFAGVPVAKVSGVTYLGIEFLAGCKLSCKVDTKLASFYRGVNGILYNASKANLRGAPNLLYFLYATYCLPILRYGLTCVILPFLTRRDLARLRIAHNSAVRRILKL